MIALICVLLVLRLGNCLEQLPTRREIETSINRTINEVERMVRDDPSLPRLSRSEIVDILFNITSTDMNSYEDRVEKTRENYQRALMVVLPYSSNDTRDESLGDLYTKAPLVKIVRDSSDSPETTIETSDNLINTRTRKNEELSDVSNHYENHRDTYTEIGAGSPTEKTLGLILKSDKNSQTAPEKFSFDLENLGTTRNNEPPSSRPFLNNFLANQAATERKSNLQIVYGTSVTQIPITRKVETTSISDKGFRPTMPPGRSTQNILTSDQWRYNAPPSSTTPQPRGSPPEDSRNRKKTASVPFLPTMMTERAEKETLPTVNPEVLTSAGTNQPQTNDGSPWDMENLRTVDENAKPPPLYVTPMSSASSAEPGASLTTADNVEATKTPMPMREEVQDLLASIGLRPEGDRNKDGTRNKANDEHEKIFGTNFHIPDTSNVIIGHASGLTALGVEPPSISGQNTFETTPQDVKKGVDNLSPDVQLLFQRFGLQSSVKDRENAATRVTTDKPVRVFTTKTSFWNNFKPLPASQVKDEGMRDFLAKFGLGIDERRNEKSMKMRKHAEDRRPSLIEAVPVNMKGILENIGLITGSQRAMETKRIETTEATNLHVFKPHETSIENEKQRAKINELLDTVKMVQDGRADVLAVQKVARELIETTKTLKNGPDPVSLEEILKMYNDDLKNEIKRQQDPKDLTDMAVSETTDSTSTTSSTEASSVDSSVGSSADSSAASSDSSANSTVSSNDSKQSGSLVEASTTEISNLAALADSFGGTTDSPDVVLPTPRKTGLYFLVDWNTFLDVGEEGKDRVNLRFQPKVGDRMRFLPVTVP